MYFITTKRMLEVCFFQHTPTFIIEPVFYLYKYIILLSVRLVERACVQTKAQPAKAGVAKPRV